jgi:sugar transferase EpsL
MIKKIVDFVFSLTACFVLLPVFALLGLLICIVIGRPIIFKQLRPGQYGNPFYIYKFRTMTEARNIQGELLPDNERMTALGKFLRSTSLDELPSLLNVLKGEMSLVGPRPLLMEYMPLYNAEQAKRHDVKPGITGWAQVNGRNAISWEDKFNLDVWYVENQSFWLDSKIILMTIKKVFQRSGISAQGNVTMPKFTGSKK